VRIIRRVSECVNRRGGRAASPVEIEFIPNQDGIFPMWNGYNPKID